MTKKQPRNGARGHRQSGRPSRQLAEGGAAAGLGLARCAQRTRVKCSAPSRCRELPQVALCTPQRKLAKRPSCKRSRRQLLRQPHKQLLMGA